MASAYSNATNFATFQVSCHNSYSYTYTAKCTELDFDINTVVTRCSLTFQVQEASDGHLIHVSIHGRSICRAVPSLADWGGQGCCEAGAAQSVPDVGGEIWPRSARRPSGGSQHPPRQPARHCKVRLTPYLRQAEMNKGSASAPPPPLPPKVTN
jgi:hypothetical protein